MWPRIRPTPETDPRSSPCTRDLLSGQAAAVQTLWQATPGPTGEEGPHEGPQSLGAEWDSGDACPQQGGAV